MSDDSLLKIADGRPLQVGNGYLPLQLASAAMGPIVAD